MPGTYAPPAVELPKTSAIVGWRRAEARVRSRKSLPPGMKISFWVGRSAPPDSTSEIVGRSFSSAICEARKIFFTVQGLLAPPFTVGSLALIMHSTPSTTPMPVTTEAPTVKSEPHPASGESSRKADPGSTSSSIRSRAVSLPRAWWRSTYFSPPPATATACWASRSASFSSMASRFGLDSLLGLERGGSRPPASLDHRLHPLQRRTHPLAVGASAQRAEEGPVDAREDRRLHPEVLRHQRPAVLRLEPVAPVVDRHRVGADGELEDPLGLARGHAARRPVRRTHTVALHVPGEVGPHLGTGGPAGPPGLERLGAELPDPRHVADEVPHLGGRRVHPDGDLVTQGRQLDHRDLLRWSRRDEVPSETHDA